MFHTCLKVAHRRTSTEIDTSANKSDANREKKIKAKRKYVAMHAVCLSVVSIAYSTETRTVNVWPWSWLEDAGIGNI